jgi:spermidine synthase
VGGILKTSRSERLLLGALVFVVGASSLGAEIAAARLLAPYFGASTIVWANTIGVVLVALSIGYWFGGRYADRHPHLRGLCLLVLGASLLIALIPFAARPFLDFSVEAFDSISIGTFAGSLVGVLVLVAVGEMDSAGEVVGRLYAISTAGSLLGTMISALLLIPLLGTQRTFIVFALCLALVATIGIGWRAVLVPAALALVLVLPVGTIKGSGEGEVLYEAETTQQYARVLERDDGTRVLELNEGQAVHSLYRPGSYLTGDYWDGHLVLPAAAASAPPGRIAILGNAGGTVARAFGHYFPRTAVDAVEIDPELTDLGERFLDLRNPRMTVYDEDARPWLRAAEGDYDAIMVDAYRQPYIPFYLTTEEFFELTRERLTPGGVTIVNVGHPEGGDELERVLGRTLAAAFPRVLRYPIEDTNTLLVAGGENLSAARLRTDADRLPADLQPLAREAATALEPRLPGGEVYTDDHAPVEWLIDESLLEYANE